MEYREFPPSPVLSPFVERLWTLAGHASELTEAAQPVLPDGRPELVLHLGDPFERVTGDVAQRQARLLFAGQLTEQLTLRPTGTMAVAGVRFHPFGAAAFLPVPQHELTGLTVGLGEVSRPLARALARVGEQTDDVRCALPLVEVALTGCVRQSHRTDVRLPFVSRRILDTKGLVSIDALARQVSISRRHLERRFQDVVGISPKRLARVTRFQNALHILEESDPRRSGAATAATCGYADQSHFIREFRQLAGCSPSEHMLRQGELTGFFVSGRVSQERSPHA